MGQGRFGGGQLGGVLAALVVLISSPGRTLAETSTLDQLASDFRLTANASQADQLMAAIASSPPLRTELVQLAASGRLEKFEIVPADDPRIKNTPFHARVYNKRIIFTAEFLQAQRPKRLYDVVTEGSVLPDNLVFALGHLAEHIEHPLEMPNPPPGREQFLSLVLHDEASAYIAGRNALAASLPGKPSVVRDGSALMNLRYRAVFIRAMNAAPDLIDEQGAIVPSAANKDAIAAALKETPVADFQ